MEALTATVELFMPELVQAAKEQKLHKRKKAKKKKFKRGHWRHGDNALGPDKNLNALLPTRGLYKGNQKTVMNHWLEGVTKYND